LVTEAEFSREIKVVMEERRLGPRTGRGDRGEALRCGGYFAHPYRRPVCRLDE
jgi:hypothetical protein